MKGNLPETHQLMAGATVSDEEPNITAENRLG